MPQRDCGGRIPGDIRSGPLTSRCRTPYACNGSRNVSYHTWNGNVLCVVFSWRGAVGRCTWQLCVAFRHSIGDAGIKRAPCRLALPRYPQRLCRGRRKKSVNTSNRSKPQAIARERSRYAGIVMRQLINGDCSMAWCKALHREQRQDRGVDASLPSSCRIYSIEAECVRLERPGRKVHDIEAPEPRDASTISGTAYSGDVNLIRVNF